MENSVVAEKKVEPSIRQLKISKKSSFVFMGCKHCGKTTQGNAVAKKTGAKFFDVDSVIEEMTGVAPRTIYSEQGLLAFKSAETAACNKIILDNSKDKDGHLIIRKPLIISAGGGLCDNGGALKILNDVREKGLDLIYVFLRLDIQFSIERIMENVSEVKPGVYTGLPAYVAEKEPSSLNDVRKILADKFNERTAKYEKLADIIIDIKNAPIEENFNSIIRALH